MNLPEPGTIILERNIFEQVKIRFVVIHGIDVRRELIDNYIDIDRCDTGKDILSKPERYRFGDIINLELTSENNFEIFEELVDSPMRQSSCVIRHSKSRRKRIADKKMPEPGFFQRPDITGIPDFVANAVDKDSDIRHIRQPPVVRIPFPDAVLLHDIILHDAGISVNPRYSYRLGSLIIRHPMLSRRSRGKRNIKRNDFNLIDINLLQILFEILHASALKKLYGKCRLVNRHYCDYTLHSNLWSHKHCRKLKSIEIRIHAPDNPEHLGIHCRLLEWNLDVERIPIRIREQPVFGSKFKRNIRRQRNLAPLYKQFNHDLSLLDLFLIIRLYLFSASFMPPSPVTELTVIKGLSRRFTRSAIAEDNSLEPEF